ncbi:MAG: sigma 54-interacting transcriptional regulator, partial [Bacteroidota bacterium]|nr:sigma 54-interacting transcriptional regulator [Bacteroidota bacterium]
NLIESELFGYDAGAFTGAKKGGNPGKFELANGGTLFLDEIGEMPLNMQVKLLRALQESTVTRVGGDKDIPVDVRIIAATNKDLKKEVEKGNFRLDLFYRLSVIPILIPSLAERKEDIPTLFNSFLRNKALKLKKPSPKYDSLLLSRLHDYDWPGNIRELENFAEKYVNLDGLLDVSLELRPSFMSEEKLTKNREESVFKSPVLESLSEMERKAIIFSLNQLNGNVSKASKVLGVSRNTLYLKMKKYHIRF